MCVPRRCPCRLQQCCCWMPCKAPWLKPLGVAAAEPGAAAAAAKAGAAAGSDASNTPWWRRTLRERRRKARPWETLHLRVGKEMAAPRRLLVFICDASRPISFRRRHVTAPHAGFFSSDAQCYFPHGTSHVLGSPLKIKLIFFSRARAKT